MTLIAAFNAPSVAVLASDRLTSMMSPSSNRYLGKFDETANKVILLITVDAAVIIGFCGSAYINGIPTDNWVVRTICPEANIWAANGQPGIFGGKRPSYRRLHQILNLVRRGFAECNPVPNMSLLAVGWRYRRKRCYPICVKIHSAEAFGPSNLLKMRFDPGPWGERNLSLAFSHIGASLTPQDFAGANMHPGRTPTMEQLADCSARNLTTIVRNVAGRSPTVGPNVMSVSLLHPTERRAVCLFDPIETHYHTADFEDRTATLAVAYRPWILTPCHFMSPSMETGEMGSGASYEADGWRFELNSISRGPPEPSNIGWSRPQIRRPLPRGAR